MNTDLFEVSLRNGAYAAANLTFLLVNSQQKLQEHELGSIAGAMHYLERLAEGVSPGERPHQGFPFSEASEEYELYQLIFKKPITPQEAEKLKGYAAQLDESIRAGKLSVSSELVEKVNVLSEGYKIAFADLTPTKGLSRRQPK
jgi:hypothetical protein